jgi:hypothetical protein
LPTAIASSVQSSPLTETGDNKAVLQAFLDSLPPGAVVQMPPGSWRVDTPLRINKTVTIQGPATIYSDAANFARGVVIVGEYNTTTKVNDVNFYDLTFSQQADGSNTRTCLEVMGDRLNCFRCTFANCQFEGVVVHGNCSDPTFTDCVGLNCGKGGPAYPLPTAAFNSHAARTLYLRCRSTNSGQGYEMSGNGTVADNCIAETDMPAIGYGFNIGSANWGVYNVTIKNSRTYGYRSAITVGNGNGRLCRVNILNNVIDGGAIEFVGGKMTNLVPGNPFEGPDLYGSAIEGNTIIQRGETYGTITYNGYYGQEQTRENLSIRRNTIVAIAQSPSTPFVQAAGTIVANVWLEDNVICESDSAPSRGDFAAFTANGHSPVAGYPNLVVNRNVAKKKDGSTRPFVTKLEGQ